MIPCSKKVAACAKHYVGDGGTFNGINEGNTIIDRNGLMKIHMPAYFNSIIRGVSTIMVSYNSWNGEKMHGNHFLITDFLKSKLKFRVSCSLQKQNIFCIFTSSGILRDTDAIIFFGILCKQGFVISDWKGIDRITTPQHLNYTYSIQAGISAGIDMVISFKK
jgi:beta-glucosidase-like glycosyl hydrolase